MRKFIFHNTPIYLSHIVRVFQFRVVYLEININNISQAYVYWQYTTDADTI